MSILWIRLLGYGKRIWSTKLGKYAVLALALWLALVIFGKWSEGKGAKKLETKLRGRSAVVVEEQIDKGVKIRKAATIRRTETSQLLAKIDKDVEDAINAPIPEIDPENDDGSLPASFVDRMRDLQKTDTDPD